MTRTFNAFEVFEIAEQIERNGAAFYRKAAGLLDQPQLVKMFLDLAEWEAKHEEVFADMRRQLSEQGRELRSFEIEDAPLDAKAMAGLAAFGISPDPTEQLTGDETKQEILRMALQKEKDSIVYYTGLKGFVPNEGGKDKIDDVIAEEMHHIRIINQSLEQCE
jgi:rubrerythrin